jgi:3-mercaptopyruvate sulfurtransferase SseA
MCASGYRSSVAASILRSAGFSDVSWVADGAPTWRRHGHAVERGAPADVVEPVAAEAAAGHDHRHADDPATAARR